MKDLYKRITVLLEENNKAFALCTLVETNGSTPRHQAKMIVFADRTSEFTIGGGPAEKSAIDLAVQAIEEDKSILVEMVLNKSQEKGLNAECGGSMKIYIEVYPIRPTLVLVGAGHVNSAVFSMAEGLGFDTVIIDDRQSVYDNQAFSGAKEIYFDEGIEKAVKKALPNLQTNSYIVIATKDDDQSALKAFAGFEAPYIGVIGSKRKIGKITEHLQEERVSEKWLSAIHMPIGLDIGGETPREIAVSIWSEILMVKYGKTGTTKQLR